MYSVWTRVRKGYRYVKFTCRCSLCRHCVLFMPGLCKQIHYSHKQQRNNLSRQGCWSATSWQRHFWVDKVVGVIEKKLFVVPIIKIDVWYLSRVKTSFSSIFIFQILIQPSLLQGFWGLGFRLVARCSWVEAGLLSDLITYILLTLSSITKKLF